ncbi:MULTISPECIES: putative bifunctional diguanylate cyclase/phosphodiesterase [Herbaspirillum]|jgi:diguanylate cyclase (GGDEF)-like protein|uniref:EAL domain-containing protein n=1 Tax=Herbaspirillum huttiense subsp. lycopersici TaxID=3074428 RepID=A0ABU2EUA6_9BURK|nr:MULTISPECIES: EAL domain-containing protein [Herbaspirillum]MAF02567.1 diguanylate cyclase [Herbaspirillum sp.]MBN9358629.1 EAL domain-containing protein [Herbaspirillum huttiense]MBO17083.1 diguanylate cyclase [Herbaspirillum sp.]MCO4859336.1 EAL domain-containing protein [Herbaspirillum sp. WGmk3]MCP3658423.1 EAL domain-containing protein [Herbaspirillum sp.]
MSASFHFLLLAFALLVASLSAYAALEVSERIVLQESQHRRLWLAIGAVVFGLGVWGAMLLTVASLDAPMPIAFDARMVVLTLLLCLSSAFYLMHLTGMRRPQPARLVIGGLAIGAAFNAAFHIALKSMTLVPPLVYHTPLLIVALVVSEVVAVFIVTLFSASNGRKPMTGSLNSQQARRVLAALLVGAGLVSSAAAGLRALLIDPQAQSLAGEGITREHLVNGLVFLAFLAMAMALVVSGVQRNQVLKKIVGRTNDKLLHFATHDVLTGLPNRALLADRIQHAVEVARRNGKPFAVLFMDLDGFKAINDSLGHAVGDGLLVAVAQRIRACIRGEDMVARIGGDEFVVVMSNLSTPEVVEQLSENILAELRLDFQIEDATLRVTSSIGIAVYPNSGESVDALMKNADAAMYEAKQSGRNTYRFFEPAMHASAMRHLQVRQALQQAIDQQQFRLHFQPKYRGAGKELTGLEALLRWHHPELGEMAPSEFIPIAERSGQILCIGDWVLHAVCRQIVCWDAAGVKPVKVALNLSPLQMRSDLVERIIKVVSASGIAPQRLMFEITETAAMKDVERTTRVVRELQSLGFDIAIDDFGTGYSSLAYLAQFHCRQVKIDRFFTSRLDLDDHSGRAIVAAIIALAHALQMEVVAEGVETEGQLRELQLLHCDQVQGFLLGRPDDAVSVPGLVDASNDDLFAAGGVIKR